MFFRSSRNNCRTRRCWTCHVWQNCHAWESGARRLKHTVEKQLHADVSSETRNTHKNSRRRRTARSSKYQTPRSLLYRTPHSYCLKIDRTSSAHPTMRHPATESSLLHITSYHITSHRIASHPSAPQLHSIHQHEYLDDRLAPVLQRAAVHLGDRGTSERLAVDRRKQLRERLAELLPDGFVHFVVRRRWYSVLKL